MMTRKTYFLAGFFLIVLSPLSMALQTYLLLSEIISKETFIYFDLFRYLAIPLGFCLLISKRLKHIGKSRRFTACSLAVFLATLLISMILFPLVALNLGVNPVSVLTNEIATWSSSGGKGDFNVSTQAKVQMVSFSAIVVALINWPLFMALYFGARGPRPPKVNNPLDRLSKHAVKRNKVASSLRKHIIS